LDALADTDAAGWTLTRILRTPTEKSNVDPLNGKRAASDAAPAAEELAPTASEDVVAGGSSLAAVSARCQSLTETDDRRVLAHREIECRPPREQLLEGERKAGYKGEGQIKEGQEGRSYCWCGSKTAINPHLEVVR
jgi:hypothetical protein